MFPILIQFPNWFPLIGGKAIHTYGLMTALGYLAGMLWIKHESKRMRLDVNKMLDLFFYIVVAAVVGGRILYVLISIDRWWMDPLVFFRIWEGGLVFYGGLIASVLLSIWYCHKNNITFFRVADLYAPGIAVGHAIGRIGCFAAGCCYGREAPHDSFWTVTYPSGQYAIAPTDHPVYPVQPLETFGLLLIFLFLVLFRKKKKFDGEIFLLYLIFYPILRIILEFFRGDAIRGIFILSTSQWISLVWLVLAVVLWVVIKKNKHVRRHREEPVGRRGDPASN